jgi:surfeit locus 1 family protein
LSRRLLVPALSTTAMLVALLGMGTWQMQRRAWKLGVLAQIDAAERTPPMPLTGDLPPFAKVGVSGRLRTDLAATYGVEVRDARSGPVLGSQLIVPLERSGAPPLLVDLGWVPRDARDPPALPQAETHIEGFMRLGERPGWFSASDDAPRRQFFTLDPPAIGAALGLPQVAPFALIALGDTPPRGYPDPAHHLPTLPNNHLQYAVTWYGLAVVLLVIFAVYVRKGASA